MSASETPAFAGIPAAPTPYPLLQNALGTTWWRPLLALLVCAVVYVLWLGMLWWGVQHMAANVWRTLPGTILLLNLTMIGLLPTSLLGARIGFGRSAGWLLSMTRRLRWRWLLRAWCIGLPFMALLGVFDMHWIDPHPWQPDPDARWLLMMTLLLTPLQCAGEEVFFRGLLPQCLGSWCRHRRTAFWLTLLLPALLFAWVHGQQSTMLFATRMLLGMLCGWLAWRSGGLEAPIALHTLNNQTSFAETIATGTLAQALFATDVSALQAVVQLAAVGLASWFMLRLQRPAATS